MTPDERAFLLAYARRCVAAAVAGLRPPDLPEPSSAFVVPGAAFVTLRSHGELRGCVGQIRSTGPLWESVRDMAEAAALRDSRFEPVASGELLVIELSLLSPMFPIRPDDIRIGVHGLHIRLGGAAGLLLPQVAVEWGWDPMEFVEHTCRKAGLPSDAWRDETAELQGFTAEHFSEVP